MAAHITLFLVAVMAVYIGGFVCEVVGPLAYSLAFTCFTSIPILVKLSFWKKILMMLPLIVMRVVGKFLLTAFGKNMLTRLMAHHGLPGRRLHQLIAGFEQSREQLASQWRAMDGDARAYLVLIFMPVVLVVVVISFLIKLVRLKFLQMIVEKLLHQGLERTVAGRTAGPAAGVQPVATHGQEDAGAVERVPDSVERRALGLLLGVLTSNGVDRACRWNRRTRF